MSTKAVIVLDTDMLESIIDNPESFVLTLRTVINSPSQVNRILNLFGIEYVDTLHSTSSCSYKVSPDGIKRTVNDS